MEKEQNPPSKKQLSGNILLKVISVAGMLGVLFSIISLYIYLPNTISSVRSIVALNPYDYFLINLAATELGTTILLGISAAAVTAAVFALFVRSKGFSSGTRMDNRGEFYRYLSIFVLVELILSFIVPYVRPSLANSPVLSMPFAVQNFVYLTSSLSQNVVEQFLPISVMSLVYLAMRGKLSWNSFLNLDQNLEGAIAPIIIISAIFGSVLISGGIIGAAINFVGLLLLDIIYVKFGASRALVSGFAISQFNLLLQVYPGFYIPYIMYGFLVIWSLLGMFGAISIFTAKTLERQKDRVSSEEQAENEEGERPEIASRQTRQLQNALSRPENLWIRSACPSCGNYNFQLLDDMSLECKNCQQKIDRDAVGEFNIRLSKATEAQG